MDESSQYDGVGVFSFVPVQDDVWLYPDSIRIKVALDDGEITGFNAKDFLISHKKRDLPKPKLTPEKAKASLNPNVKVQETRIALVTNELSQEVLCYEILGTIENDTFRMFINANDGTEEKVQKMKSAEPIYNDL